MSEILWGPTCDGRCGLAPGDHRHGSSTGGNFTGNPAEPPSELREALAEWLFRYNRGPLTFWHEISEVAKDSRRDDADQLLSGPLAPLLAKLRAGLALADELDEDSRDALKIGAAARDRGDREVHRISARHARVAHHAASQLRAALAPLAGQHTTDEEADRG